MKISRGNYETYIIDYFDGRLNAAETAGLMLFLEQNPDIRSEFDAFETIKLDAPGYIIYNSKDDLKKKIVPESDIITEDNFEEIFFEAVEDTLGESDKQSLQRFLTNNPGLQRDYDLLQKTRLQPPTIVYPNKARLKKTLVIPFYRRVAFITSAAAAIAMLLIAGILTFRGNSGGNKGNVAVNIHSDENTAIRPAKEEKVSPYTVGQKNSYSMIALNNKDTENKSNTEAKQNDDRTQVIAKIVAQRQLAYIPVNGSTKEDRIKDYQTTYTDIIANIDIREKIKQGNGNMGNSNNSLAQKAMKKIHKAAGDESDRYDNTRFSLWDVADIGVAGYNALSKKDVKVERQTDENGRTISYALGNIEYSRNK